MLKIRTLLMTLLLACAYALNAQVVYTEPPVIQQSTKNFTVYFNAAEGTAGLKSYSGTVYAHTGVITSASNSGSDWKHAPSWGDNSDKYKLTRVSGDLYALQINDIKEYYGVGASEVVKQLAFVFRSEDNSLEGKETGGKDIFVDVHEDGLAISLVTKSSNVFSEANNKVDFTVYSTQDADIAIYMGCNVECPFIGRAFDDNWGLEDPTGKTDEEFKMIIKEIESRILQLKNELI